MKTIKLILLFTAVSFSFIANAQSVDDIIAKHVDAVGGKDKISQVKSVVMHSTISVMGSDNPSTSTLLSGVGFISESDINGQKIVQCYTAKGGWSINPFAGGTDPVAMPDDQYQAGKYQIYLDGVLPDYAAKGYKAELEGKDGNSYKIKLTAPNNVESTYFIDTTSYQLNKMVTKGDMQGQPVDITSTFSDYRKTDAGVMVPYKIDVDLGQFQLSYAVNKIDVNTAVDPKIFDMPGK